MTAPNGGGIYLYDVGGNVVIRDSVIGSNTRIRPNTTVGPNAAIESDATFPA